MSMQPRTHSLLMALVALVVFCGAFLVARRHPARPLVPAGVPQPYGPVATSGTGAASTPAIGARPSRGGESVSADIAELRSRNLLVPIEGAEVERWKGSFEETHNGHQHEAVDILAPRNTPIHAVDDGRIAKLFDSKAGGLTVYEIDPSERFMFYYAHLERYSDVHEGDRVTRGEVIGFVGTSGNAPPGTPHLHFTIFRVDDPHRWWEGTAIDPYLVFSTTAPD